METEKTLREIVEEAAHQVQTFKYPDVSEMVSRLDPILKAAGLGSIGNDTITDIDFYNTGLCISTEYTVRGCHQTSNFVFPVFLLDSEDPIYDAKTWALNKKMTVARSELISAKARAVNAEAHLDKLMKEYVEHEKSKIK